MYVRSRKEGIIISTHPQHVVVTEGYFVYYTHLRLGHGKREKHRHVTPCNRPNDNGDGARTRLLQQPLPRAPCHGLLATGSSLTDALVMGSSLTDALVMGSSLTDALVMGSSLTDALVMGSSLTDALVMGSSLNPDRHSCHGLQHEGRPCHGQARTRPSSSLVDSFPIRNLNHVCFEILSV
jgi:hypothetical protein